MYVELPDLAEKGRTPVVESEAEEEDATGGMLCLLLTLLTSYSARASQ